MFVKVIDGKNAQFVNVSAATRFIRNDKFTTIELPGLPVIDVPTGDFDAVILPAMTVHNSEVRTGGRNTVAAMAAPVAAE